MQKYQAVVVFELRSRRLLHPIVFFLPLSHSNVVCIVVHTFM